MRSGHPVRIQHAQMPDQRIKTGGIASGRNHRIRMDHHAITQDDAVTVEVVDGRHHDDLPGANQVHKSVIKNRYRPGLQKLAERFARRRG